MACIKTVVSEDKTTRHALGLIQLLLTFFVFGIAITAISKIEKLEKLENKCPEYEKIENVYIKK
jgi:hypothetical protein